MRRIMKHTKGISYLFFLAGTLLLAAAGVLCLKYRNENAWLAEVPREAEQQIISLMDAVAARDYDTVSSLLYGQPQLLHEQGSEDEIHRRLWEAYSGSIQYSFPQPWAATQTGLTRDIEITALDAAAIAAALPERTQSCLEEMEGEPDIEAALNEALDQLLQEEPATVTRRFPLELVFQDGQWWVLPGEKMLDLLAGSLPE